jgi:tetratricopeptide (TPR) repeat protein
MKTWRWVVLAFCLVLPGARFAYGDEVARDAFLRGNKLYQAGDFAGALSAYEEVASRGLTAPELEYNLGNAALKSGRIGSAVLHYRRALAQRPNYESAWVNLNYARSLTQDLKSEAPPSQHQGWTAGLRLGPGRAGFLLFLAVTLFLASDAWRRMGNRAPGWLGGAEWTAAAVALLLVAALVFEWSQLSRRKEGVILAEETEVHVGPSPEQTVSFRLHQGTEVDILRSVPGWIDVRVSPELEGWVPETTLEPI